MVKKIVDRLRKTSDFTKNVLRIISGSSIAQIISFATLPIITRLYSKEDIGLFQLLISIIATFGVVTSLKYEMAIVLPEDEDEAESIIHLAVLILFFTTFILSIFFFVGSDFILRLLNATEIKPYIIFVSLGIFIKGLQQIYQQILVRSKKFNCFAKSTIIDVSTKRIGSVLGGFFFPSFAILFYSYMIGSVVSIVYIIKHALINFKNVKIDNLKCVFKKYIKFPLINTIVVFVNSFSMQLPVFMLSKYFGAEILGYYSMANRAINLPINLIGMAVSKVYFQEASRAYNNSKEKMLTIYKSTVLKLSLLGLLPLISVLLLGPFLADLVFGRDWHETGLYMQILIVYIYFRFICSPISITFTIINKQEIGLILVLFSITIRFIAMYIFSYNPVSILVALSVTASVFYITFILYVYIILKGK